MKQLILFLCLVAFLLPLKAQNNERVKYILFAAVLCAVFIYGIYLMKHVDAFIAEMQKDQRHYTPRKHRITVDEHKHRVV